MRLFRSALSLCCLAALPAAAPSSAALSLTTTVVDFSAAVPAGVCPALVTHAGDASRRLFVLDKRGYVWQRDPANPTEVLATPFLNVDASVTPNGCFDETGLLGLAFHPDFETNAYLYLYYTNNAGDQQIDRIDTGALNPDGTPQAGAQTPVLVMCDPAGNHNGGMIAFGPFDGYLYVSTGDGGGSCDNSGEASGGNCVAAPAGPHGQALDTLLGKMLRLDVDGADAFPGDPDRNYAIPPDNPYVGEAGDDELWTLGLRNPWRFTFDRLNGDLWIGDVGQGNYEEISRLPADLGGGTTGGRNLGWLCCEGAHDADASCGGWTAADCGFSTCLQSNGDYDAPAIDVDRDIFQANAIIGGYRYRGPTVADFREPPFAGTVGPAYVFTAGDSSRIWIGTFNGIAWVHRDLGDMPPGEISAVHSLGEDERGEIWVAEPSSNGPAVRQFVDPASIFGDGFEIGDTLDWSATQP